MYRNIYNCVFGLLLSLIFAPHATAKQSHQQAHISCNALLESFELNQKLLTEMSLHSAEYEDRNETVVKLIRQRIPLEKQLFVALRNTKDLALFRAYLKLQVVEQKELLVVTELPGFDHQKLQDIATKIDNCLLI